MVSVSWLMMVVACSPVHRIPAPEPAPSVLPSSVARAHYLRGQVLAVSGDLEGAEYSLSRARIFDSDEPRILMALGSVAMTKGDVKGALDRYFQAAALADSDPDPWFAHGRMEMAFGDKDVGRTALRRSIRLGAPWEARAMLIADQLRVSGLVSEELEQWSAMVVEDNIELRSRAELRLAAGDSAGAIGDLLFSLRQARGDVSLVHPIVRTATIGRRIAQTLISLERLVEVEPNRPAAWMVLGMLSHVIGDHQYTVHAFEKVEALGVTLESAAADALAAARVESAGAQIVDGETPIQQPGPLGQILVWLEQERWDEAERLVKQELESHPDEASLLYIMGQIHLDRDGPSAAVPWVNQVVNIAPHFSPGLNLWAWVHAELGRSLDEAENRSRQALVHQPRTGSYWDTLGWVLMKQGKPDVALPIMERAVRLSPNDDDVLARRDSCRSSLGSARQ